MIELIYTTEYKSTVTMMFELNDIAGASNYDTQMTLAGFKLVSAKQLTHV